MKQFSFCLTQIDELPVCIAEFKTLCPASRSCIFVSIFTAWSDPVLIQRMLKQFAHDLPEAQILGCTSAGEIHDGSLKLYKTSLSFHVFENAVVTTTAFDCSADDGEQKSLYFTQAAAQQKDLVGIEVVATVKNLNIQPFLVELSKIDARIPIFGGGADTYLDESPTYIFSNTVISSRGIGLACFSGTALQIHTSSNFGWKPLGRPMRITATDGDCIIKELDHQPAISVYEKYLNITKDALFHKDTMEFPIFIERQGHYLARLPITYREDGALTFAADCRLGENVRLAFGDPNEMLQDACVSPRDMAAFHPEGILLFSCFVHRIFLQNDVGFELNPYRAIAPTSGFYTYGEITRLMGTAVIQNMMLLAVGFREGPASEAAISIQQKQPQLSRSMFLVQRLVRFISATTAELEDANHKLEGMAKLDRLTKLYNRGEIELLLKKSLEARTPDSPPFSAIMIDLDNFKDVNDLYGHDMGDHVLCHVAEILLHNIRQNDAAGRWGGEEFVLLLAGADAPTASSIADRIRQKIASMQLLPKGRIITASLGVAELHPSENYSAFYQRLDRALYQVKDNGKNHVRIAD